MAFEFPKFFNLSKMDARSRIFVLVAAVVGIGFITYLGIRFLSGDEDAAKSRVASAPQGLQSVPGAALTPEYQRALQQANVQTAQQAQMTGGSAVPTLINYGGTQASAAGCVICSDDAANVKNNLEPWVKEGKISPEVAAELQALADANVSEAEYAAKLDELVRQGKLTPEQARALLDAYRKQHANRLLQESAKAMDELIKNGQLPVDVAATLLAAQRNKVSPSDYAAMLQEMVKDGRISPEVAQRLLAQYAQQRAKEIIMRSIAILNQMARSGQITPDVLKQLVDMETAMVPVDVFSAALQKLVAAGKITPAVSTKVLDEFKAQKAEIGPSATLNQLIQQAEAEAYAEIRDLLKDGKITPDVASLLVSLIQKNVSYADFQKTISDLVQQKKLTPEIAKLKLADYKKIKDLRDLADRLAALQGNNASLQDYADELKRAVAAGILTPEQAAELMQQYQALLNRPLTQAGAAATREMQQLQQRVAQGAVTTTPIATAEEFNVPVVQPVVVQENPQDRAARIQAIMAAMAAQAQQLIGAWTPPVMVHKEGTFELAKAVAVAGGPGSGPPGSGPTSGPPGMLEGAPLIKAGTILFGVLDTTVNSDYPDSPVLVTIVAGDYKGAKLLGKLQTTKNVVGQMDRIALNFSLMNMDQWPKSKTITAYAIDPDTARSVMASSVDYHYLMRFGAIMATSFLQGYANAITTSSSTTTTGIFGTSTSHPELSPSQKLMVALGQIGQTLGAVTQQWTQRPPTVKVDSGVGLGILFMADVT